MTYYEIAGVTHGCTWTKQCGTSPATIHNFLERVKDTGGRIDDIYLITKEVVYEEDLPPIKRRETQ